MKMVWGKISEIFNRLKEKLFQERKFDEGESNVEVSYDYRIEKMDDLVILKPSDVPSETKKNKVEVTELLVISLENYEDVKFIVNKIKEETYKIFIIDYDKLFRKSEDEVARVFSVVRRYSEEKGYHLSGLKGFSSRIAVLYPEGLKVKKLK